MLDLQFTELNSVVIYLRYALFAFKISSPHYNFKSLLNMNYIPGFRASILDRLRLVLNNSTIILAGIVWIEQTQNSIV